jgi:alpha-D-xyloside xylohydrolase
MVAQRTFNVVWISQGKPVAWNPEAPSAQKVPYSGAAVTVKMQ